MDGQASEAPISAPHGVKRRAEDDPPDEQRLAKRFDLLNLEQNGKLYVPIPNHTASKNAGSDDSMHLDDTKDKVYIHNLDDELASVEAEEAMVFLPDIEKKIGKIPHHVLTGDLQPTSQNQMVLYGVPNSISVPPDQDNVRKAILETRARAREKQLENAEVENKGKERINFVSTGYPPNDYESHSMANGTAQEGGDDAMDIG